MSDIRPDSTPEQLRIERDNQIHLFGQKYLSGPNQDLYEEILVTVCRMAKDQASRQDAKMLNRAMAELRYAFKIFAPYRDIRKISIFGSARTPEDHPNYLAAVEFSRRMGLQNWMIITGAGDGIMKAGHGGAGREASFGVAIRLPFEQKTNEFIAEDAKLVNFRYFFTRKLMFLKEASAVALFPGGFGTQDEGFEVLTLVQTGKSAMVPIVMIEEPGGTYWAHWKRYVVTELLSAGLISEPDLSLFRITDNVDQAMHEVINFYRVFHSLRYVGDRLVLRLNHAPSPELIEKLNDLNSEIVSKGRIESTGPLAEEGGEYVEKPRLTFIFDRRNHGVLRRMIDMLNAEA